MEGKKKQMFKYRSLIFNRQNLHDNGFASQFIYSNKTPKIQTQVASFHTLYDCPSLHLYLLNFFFFLITMKQHSLVKWVNFSCTSSILCLSSTFKNRPKALDFLEKYLAVDIFVYALFVDRPLSLGSCDTERVLDGLINKIACHL